MKIRDTIKNSINEIKERKHSHADVSFRLSQNSDRCDTCKAYVEADPPHCKKVVDPIYANAWCQEGHDSRTGRPFDPTFED
jgi:hypothetical protein